MDERRQLPSASKLPLITSCAGSWNLIKQAPPEKTNPAAESGQRVHDALKTGTFTGLTTEENDVAKQCERLELRWITNIQFAAPLVYSERRIWLRDDAGALLMSCRFDRAIRENEVAALVDFKTGRVPVPHPRENWQIKSEVIMFFDCFDFEVCHTAILQPWVSPQLFTHTFYREEFDRIREELVLILKRAADPNARRTPGRHCFHCPARAICPEGRSTVVEVLNCENAQLSGLQLSKDLDTFDAAESVINARRLLAEEILSSSPSAIPGWKLDKGGEPELIDDAAAAYDLVRDDVTVAQFLSCCRLSVTQFRALWARAKRLHPDDSKAAVSEVMATVIKRQPRKPSLRKINQ